MKTRTIIFLVLVLGVVTGCAGPIGEFKLLSNRDVPGLEVPKEALQRQEENCQVAVLRPFDRFVPPNRPKYDTNLAWVLQTLAGRPASPGIAYQDFELTNSYAYFGIGLSWCTTGQGVVAKLPAHQYSRK